MHVYLFISDCFWFHWFESFCVFSFMICSQFCVWLIIKIWFILCIAWNAFVWILLSLGIIYLFCSNLFMYSLLELNIEHKLSSIMLTVLLLMIVWLILCCGHLIKIISSWRIKVSCSLMYRHSEFDCEGWFKCNWWFDCKHSWEFYFWSESTKRKLTFDENTRNLGSSSSGKLMRDYPTRWNFTYLIFHIAL